MSTTQKTSNKLTVKYIPWFIWILAGFSSVVTLPMAVSVLLQSIPKKLTCERIEPKQINCQFQENQLSSKKNQIQGLQGAKFKTNSDSNFFPHKQQLILLTKEGEVKFLSYPSYKPEYSKNKMLRNISQINEFVNNLDQQYLELETGNFILEWIILTSIINSLLIIIFMGEISICEFDPSTGYMTKKRRWLFLFSKTTKYSLTDIKDVETESTRHKSIVYRTTITLTSGTKIPLSTYYSSYLKSRKKMKSTANKIRKFLSLPNN